MASPSDSGFTSPRRASWLTKSVISNSPRGDLAKRLGDSKALVRFGDTALGEAWARAVLAMTRGCRFESPDQLIASMSMDGREALRRRCPEHHVDQCWSREGERFTFSEEIVPRVLEGSSGAVERCFAGGEIGGQSYRRQTGNGNSSTGYAAPTVDDFKTETIGNIVSFRLMHLDQHVFIALISNRLPRAHARPIKNIQIV